MKQLETLLGNCLSEQVALEERLHKEVEYQIGELPVQEFKDVRELLSNVKAVLECQFHRLNRALDRLEEAPSPGDLKTSAVNASQRETLRNAGRERVSQMLRDDYVALSSIAIGNALLHTTALAADSSVVAEVALAHLANVTPFVAEINELTPKVAARELALLYPVVAPSVGDVGARNTRSAWQPRKPSAVDKDYKD